MYYKYNQFFKGFLKIKYYQQFCDNSIHAEGQGLL